MADKTRDLLRRAVKVLTAILRKENIPEDDVRDLASDIAEYLEGYNIENN